MKILMLLPIVVAIFIDLDKPNITDVDYYYVKKRSLVTPFVLQVLFWKNPKTIITFKDTNTTIIPTDEVLVTPNSEISQIQNLKYVEILYVRQILRNTMIPLTPCISRYDNFGRFDPDGLMSAPVGVVTTHRTAVYLRLSLGFGLSLGEAIVINTVTLGFTLGYKLTAKLTKQRMIDTTVGCYLNHTGYSARVFGYIPSLEVTPQIRKIIYNRKKVVVDHAWEDLKPMNIMMDSTVRTLCQVGSRQELQCNANNGEVVDTSGNTLSWKIL